MSAEIISFHARQLRVDQQVIDLNEVCLPEYFSFGLSDSEMLALAHAIEDDQHSRSPSPAGAELLKRVGYTRLDYALAALAEMTDAPLDVSEEKGKDGDPLHVAPQSAFVP